MKMNIKTLVKDNRMWAIITGTFFLLGVPLIILRLFKNDLQFLNCYVLSVTFIVIWWYSVETHLLRKTAIEQKELQIQPLLIIYFTRNETKTKTMSYFKNIGNGIAMNISTRYLPKKEGREITIDLKNSIFLEQGDQVFFEHPIEIINDKDGCRGSEADLNPNTAVDDYEFIITYENMQRVKYETHISTGVSGIKLIHWGKVK